METGLEELNMEVKNPSLLEKSQHKEGVVICVEIEG